ncbi:dual OB domain-containing protein [Mesorhizobium sp. IMUNJ 23232]|uniref:dual OB domain-containing protein n=1 Tax=Mesorhizobium sp. IMUNJ 23232 TaxID=3376064 RepID=UPI0037B1ADF3
MAVFEIIITDITCYGTLYCVAGWEHRRRQMIRPEPPTASNTSEGSRFWNEHHVGPGRPFSIGNIIRFDASPPPNDFPFPHATEDCLVNLSRPIDIVGNLAFSQIARAVAGGISSSLEAAFDGGLVRVASGKAYVAGGHFGRSLGAIEIAPSRLQLYVDTYGDKQRLRCRIGIGNNLYDLSVPADAARTRWKAAGIDVLQNDAKGSTRIHVRVGLSRPFGEHPCYAQVNGLYFL